MSITFIDSKITPFDYSSALELYPDIFTANLVALASMYDNKTITDCNQYSDIIIYNFLKHRPNIHIFTFYFKLEDKIENKIKDFLSKNGNIYYIKYLEFSPNSLSSLKYQITFDKKCIIDDFPILVNNEIFTIIFYENMEIIDWNFLRRSIQEIIDDKKMFITNNYQDAIELSQIYLNSNTLIFLEHQKLEKYSSKEFNKSRALLISLKNWLYKNIKLKNLEDYIIDGSFLLCIYGLKNSATINMYINNDENIDMWKHNLSFLSIEKSTIKNKIWKYKLYQPEYYFYFMGLKFMSLDEYIVKKQDINNIIHYADLIMINEKLNRNLILSNLNIDVYEVSKVINKIYNECIGINELNKLIKKTYIRIKIKN